MQKLNLSQSQTQKLSPQQIQFIKLLQIPTAELLSRIEEEIADNPVLEEGRDDEPDSETPDIDDLFSDIDKEDRSKDDDLNLDDFVNQDDVSGYKMQGDGPYGSEEDREVPVVNINTLHEDLLRQLGFLQLDPKQAIIGEQLIGTIESDGYIRRPLQGIANDLLFARQITTNPIEVEEILKMIQRFDPPGIAARDLQECLLLQLDRRDAKNPHVQYAKKIVRDCFEELKKKHFKKIERKMQIDEEQLREAINIIIALNPKPGGSNEFIEKAHMVVPDFIVRNENGVLIVETNSKVLPELRVNRGYAEILQTYQHSSKKDKNLKQAASFVKQKLDSAKWFIDAIRERNNTLLKTMNAILEYQYDFFEDGEETKLRPMILKDIADRIKMDISTVSRVANSKAVQTDFGIFPLKFFFSESISTDSGEDVSSKEVKFILKELIEKEDKNRPLSDDKLEKLLRARGYQIARRTVAKYREQMNIPVARLRKEI